MFFRTQRTLSENILMIFDPLPVKFLPQKNCWFGPKIALFSVVNCPGAKNGVIKNFCCTKKWPRRGQKIKKNFFFRKNIRKMEKSNFGTYGTLGKNSNVVMKNGEMFFCGIWDDWASNSDMTVILQIFGLWTLKKIQKNFFHFYEFFLKIWYKKGQKSGIFYEKRRNVFFSKAHPIFLEFF